jgi:hypothetical protein
MQTFKMLYTSPALRQFSVCFYLRGMVFISCVVSGIEIDVLNRRYNYNLIRMDKMNFLDTEKKSSTAYGRLQLQ